MKVSTAIRMLQEHYEPEDEIAISWWDSEWAESLLTDEEVTPEQAKDLFLDNVDILEEVVSEHGGSMVSDYLFKELDDMKGKEND